MNAVKHISECFPSSGYAANEAQLLRRALKLLSKKLCESGAAMTSPEAASEQARLYLNLMLAQKEQEVFVVMFLDNQHCLIDVAEMFRGTIDGAPVYPREVVKAALAANAAAVILAHNHPSGSPKPSGADKLITKKLQESLGLVDVRVLDHIIVGKQLTFSFAGAGLID